jgi:hypothetical protein
MVSQEIKDRLKGLETRLEEVKSNIARLSEKRTRLALLDQPGLHIDEHEEYDQQWQDAVEAYTRAVREELRLLDEIRKLKREHGMT